MSVHTDVFKEALRDLGKKQRFASADSIPTTARLERFWKTLKKIAGVRLVATPESRGS